MTRLVVLHGRVLQKQGKRYFAVPKQSTLTDRIAQRTTENLRTSWDKIMDSPLGGHVICNQKRADARRDAFMRRMVIKGRFT